MADELASASLRRDLSDRKADGERVVELEDVGALGGELVPALSAEPIGEDTDRVLLYPPEVRNAGGCVFSWLGEPVARPCVWRYHLDGDDDFLGWEEVSSTIHTRPDDEYVWSVRAVDLYGDTNGAR